MSLLELGGKKFTIPVGEVALGSDPACAIRLTGAAVLPRRAVFQGQPDGQGVIRTAAPAAEVLIDGVRLGSAQAPQGYGLVDSSTNGTFVNDERVEAQRVLQRADVIRMGEESFRFYADVVPASTPGPQPGPAAEAPSAAPPLTGAPVRGPAAGVLPVSPVVPAPAPAPAAAPAAAAAPVPAPVPPPSRPAAPPAGASERLKHTMHGVEAVPRPAQAATPPLASLLVKSGTLKNQRFPVRTPVFNIGR